SPEAHSSSPARVRSHCCSIGGARWIAATSSPSYLDAQVSSIFLRVEWVAWVSPCSEADIENPPKKTPVRTQSDHLDRLLPRFGASHYRDCLDHRSQPTRHHPGQPKS